MMSENFFDPDGIRKAYNAKQTKNEYKFQRTYKLVVGIPTLASRYSNLDVINPNTVNPESRRFIPNIAGGSYDITSPTANTPIDTEIIGAPYFLRSCILDQEQELGFRVVFTANKSDSENPQIERITVFNPPNEFLDMVNEPGAVVKLYCGYLNNYKNNTSLLINGTVASSDYRDDGVDKVLTIDVGQLGSTYETRWIARQFGANTKVIDIIEHLAKYLVRNSIVLDQYSIDFPIFPTVGSEYPVFGDALTALQNLTKSWGFNTFISAGTIYVKSAISLQGFESSKVIRISDKSGLIGKPEYIVDKKDQSAVKNQIRFKCLLDPNINLRTRVKINSAATTTGIYDQSYTPQSQTQDLTVIVSSMVIKGDSFSGDWYNECIADIVKDTSTFPNTNDVVVPLAQRTLLIGS